MKLANDYAIGEESMHAGRSQILVLDAPDSSDAKAGRSRNRNHDCKHKEPEPDSGLLATTNETTPDKDSSGKKQ